MGAVYQAYDYMPNRSRPGFRELMRRVQYLRCPAATKPPLDSSPRAQSGSLLPDCGCLKMGEGRKSDVSTIPYSFTNKTGYIPCFRPKETMTSIIETWRHM